MTFSENDGIGEDEVFRLAAATGAELKRLGLLAVTAESCTGGLISAAFTAVPGSSEWFDRAFVTYSNAAKTEMLGVGEDTLRERGAVSEETVREMSLGALRHSRGDIAVAVSGIAGPGGGTPEKPVGTVYLSWAFRGEVFETFRAAFSGDREAVRKQTVIKALSVILEFCRNKDKNNLQA